MNNKIETTHNIALPYKNYESDQFTTDLTRINQEFQNSNLEEKLEMAATNEVSIRLIL